MAKTVTFLSKDKKNFVCPLNVAIMSNTIKNIIEDADEDENDEDNNFIPLTNFWYDDIETIFSFLESRLYKEDPFELDGNAKNVFYKPTLPIMINIVNFLDIEPLLNLLISVFAYKVEASYTYILKPDWPANEIKFALFYKLPSEIILMCLKKIKTPVLFKLCMLYHSFWEFMKMIPVENFNFLDFNDLKEVSTFLNHIKTLNDDDITNFVIDIFATGLSINNSDNIIIDCRTLLFNFLMDCPMFLGSIEFDSTSNEYKDLVIALFHNNDIEKFEKICKATFNEEEDTEFNFDLYCTMILEKYDESFLEIIRKYIEMSNTFDGFDTIDFQSLYECALITGHYDISQFARENGAVFIDYDEEEDSYTPGSISYAVVGNNLDCVKYVIDQYLEKNDTPLFNIEWKNYIKWAAGFSTVEIINYIISNIEGIQNIFDNLYEYILEWALANGNIELVKYALVNGAIFNDNMHTRIIEYNLDRKPNESNIDDFTDFDYYTLSLTDNTKNNIEKCMTIIHSHNNKNES